MSEFSNDVKALISKLQNFSNSKIKNEEALAFLIEIKSGNINDDDFEQILFLAKYINGLGKIIHNYRYKLKGELTLQENESFVKQELSENLKKFAELLNKFIGNYNSDYIEIFKLKFLRLNQESLMNITSLIYDLAWLKAYKNSFK